jgi:hypothetical protein
MRGSPETGEARKPRDQGASWLQPSGIALAAPVAGRKVSSAGRNERRALSGPAPLQRHGHPPLERRRPSGPDGEGQARPDRHAVNLSNQSCTI